MARQIIKQPNGLFCVWSSVVDDFIMMNATPQDIIDCWVLEEKEEIENRVKDVTDQISKGENPYHGHVKTFSERVDWVKVQHGQRKSDLRRKDGEKLVDKN